MIPHEIPASPWQKVATVIFSLWKSGYIIIANYTSKFSDPSQLEYTNASIVVMQTKCIFSKCGIPREVISDNGPQYTSHEYGTFAHDWDFHHITTSPKYPQSNGFIEWTIQTVIKTLKKALHSANDLVLLDLHTTPLSHDKPAPATILMNCQFHTTLSTVSNTLQPTKKPSRMKAAEKSKADKPCHTHRPLVVGDSVRFRGKGAWDCKGVILDKCNQLRSYNIGTDKGTTVRWNRRHLLQAKDSFDPFENLDLLDFDQD